MRNSITILFLFFTLSSSAQVWIDQNANWHYDYWVIGSSGFYEMKYVQDTVVGGKLCQQIEKNQYIFDFLGSQIVDTVFDATQYTYVSSDTVFYWNDNQFFTLFNFGATIGDQWLIGISDPNSGIFSCHDSSYVEVTDTGSIAINSVNYRTITLTTTDSSSLGLEGTFVERFGFIDSNVPFQPFPRYMNCDSGIIFEWVYATFKCFEDDSFPLYNPSGEDCEPFTTGFDDQNPPLTQFQFFPNPTTNLINVISDAPGNLKIIDCTGKLIRSYTISHSELIDLSYLANGLYIISFQSTSGSLTKERLLKVN